MSLDYQEDLLHSINKDLLLVNSNLKVSTTEVNMQGGQINNIQGHIDETDSSVKTTDHTMFRIEARAKIYRLMLYTLVVLEFGTIICLLIRKIFR